jgi:hypothetical protein
MLGKRLPSVGVVVPNHNRMDELCEAIASVKAQEYEGKVCVYVVYRERPGIADLLSAFGDVVALPSTGEAGRNSISVKRNIGLAATTEDFVAFLDDDDIWHPDKLTAQVQAFQRGGGVVAIGTRPTYFMEIPNWRVQSGDEGFRDHTRRNVLSGRFFGTSSLLVVGTTARRLRFDERPEWLALEDFDFKIRLSRLGGMRELTGRYTAYRANNASISVSERRHTLLRCVSVLAASAEQDSSRLPHQLMAFKMLVVSTFGGYGSVQEFHGSEDRAAEEFLDQILDGRLFGRLESRVGNMVRTGWRRGWTARPVRRVVGALKSAAVRLIRSVRGGDLARN